MEELQGMKLLLENWREYLKEGIELGDAKTSSEMIEEYPFLADDIEQVGEWFPSKELKFYMGEIETEKIKKDILGMISTYEEFPKDKKRTDKIVKLLKQGQRRLPIFIEKDDPDLLILEGRHRMVANYLLGYEKIPVVYVEVQDSEGIKE